MGGNLYFDFNLKADAVLVLDVLRTSEALEDAALDHDAHLSAESFSFFH